MSMCITSSSSGFTSVVRSVQFVDYSTVGDGKGSGVSRTKASRLTDGKF